MYPTKQPLNVHSVKLQMLFFQLIHRHSSGLGRSRSAQFFSMGRWKEGEMAELSYIRCYNLVAWSRRNYYGSRNLMNGTYYRWTFCELFFSNEISILPIFLNWEEAATWLPHQVDGQIQKTFYLMYCALLLLLFQSTRDWFWIKSLCF